MNLRILSLCALLLLLAVQASPSIAAADPNHKKLIEYGWDVPEAAYVKAHITEMEQQPFDGLIFHLPGWPTNIFSRDKWTDQQSRKALDDCTGIHWNKFTDNFITILSASTMDWFSDTDWAAVRSNLDIVAQAAALAHCRGICFDAEPYGKDPWDYPNQAHAGQKSFAEYQAKARQRGAEFMNVIQKRLPSAVIHTFFQLSYFGGIAGELDPARREARLAADHYSLLPAFLNGMLDAAGPNIMITDGNESSYYYTTPLQFYTSYHLMKQDVLPLVAPENRAKYRSQVQASQALYVDYLFALGRWGKQNQTPASGLSPEERARWFEHNTYYALTTADEFVWLYSENMNWWTHEHLPPGLTEAVQSARSKVALHQPLGFEMAAVLKTAADRQKADLEAKLLRRTASIPRTAVPPVIDGRLTDTAWMNSPALEPFVQYVNQPGQPAAPTRVRVCYDDRALYLAVECSEPKPAAMKIVGQKHDDPVWEGDSIDIFLAKEAEPAPYLHFILNPNNVQWDALGGETDDLAFNPKWQSATARTPDGWTAEIALPWSELRLKSPAAGDRIRANVCRQRIPDAEQTSWSQLIQGFFEPDHLGTWIFG